jgi:hypothetical protein
MARRRRSVALALRPTVPTIRIATPRSVAVRAPVRHRRRARGRGGGRSVTPIHAAVVGLVIGMAEKSGVLEKLPEIPVLGKLGTTAVALAIWSRYGAPPMVRDAAMVCAALAGHEFGREGKITGSY